MGGGSADAVGGIAAAELLLGWADGSGFTGGEVNDSQGSGLLWSTKLIV